MKELILLHTEKSLPGQVSLESVNRHAAFPGSLNALEKEYDNLLRVDKSSLVNIDKIVSYDSRKRILYLVEDISCNVSFRKSPKVNQVFVKKDWSDFFLLFINAFVLLFHVRLFKDKNDKQ